MSRLFAEHDEPWEEQPCNTCNGDGVAKGKVCQWCCGTGLILGRKVGHVLHVQQCRVVMTPQAAALNRENEVHEPKHSLRPPVEVLGTISFEEYLDRIRRDDWPQFAAFTISPEDQPKYDETPETTP